MMSYLDFPVSVGNEVAIARVNERTGRVVYAKYGKVTKINGHGHIFVHVDDEDTEYKFDRRGDLYKNEYGPSLYNAEAMKTRLEIQKRRIEITKAAYEIEDVIKRGRSGNGDFHASTERVAELKRLVCELENLIDTE